MQHLKSDEQVFATIGILDNKILVVKFGAAWCGPCNSLAPQFENLASSYAGNPDVAFFSVDVDECGGASKELGIANLPTIKFFKKGKYLSYITGNNIE